MSDDHERRGKANRGSDKDPTGKSLWRAGRFCGRHSDQEGNQRYERGAS